MYRYLVEDEVTVGEGLEGQLREQLRATGCGEVLEHVHLVS